MLAYNYSVRGWSNRSNSGVFYTIIQRNFEPTHRWWRNYAIKTTRGRSTTRKGFNQDGKVAHYRRYHAKDEPMTHVLCDCPNSQFNRCELTYLIVSIVGPRNATGKNVRNIYKRAGKLSQFGSRCLHSMKPCGGSKKPIGSIIVIIKGCTGMPWPRSVKGITRQG